MAQLASTTVYGNLNVIGKAITNKINSQEIYGGQLSIGSPFTDARLEVGEDDDSDEIIRVRSGRGFAGLELLGDTKNASGEPGGAYIRLSQDGGSVHGIFGIVQSAGRDGSGNTYTGTVANSVLLGHTHESAPLHLGSNNTVRMTIAANGRVGIGTTSPTQALHVVGSIHVTGAITAGAQGTNTDHLVRSDRTIAAGDGMTGGGNLTTNRTITLGTPSSITATSTNSVSATSHTHAISLATLTPGTGINGDSYDGKTNRTWSVAYGSTAGTAVEGNKTITVSAGDGLGGGGTVTLGSEGEVTLNNTDKGSDQNIFKNIEVGDWSGSITASNNNDTLRIKSSGPLDLYYDSTENEIVFSAREYRGTNGAKVEQDVGDPSVYFVSVDNTVVRTSGDQIISGKKAFNEKIEMPNGIIIGSHTYNVNIEENSIAIGNSSGSDPSYNNTISIGRGAWAYGDDAVAIGRGAYAESMNAVGIGRYSQAWGSYSIAIGDHSETWASNSIAIGGYSITYYDYSTAIGYQSSTTKSNQIRLGRDVDEVSVPGDLVVDGTIEGQFVIESRTDDPPNPVIGQMWIRTDL